MDFTSQFIFSVLIALSQFIEPYSENQIKKFTAQEIEAWKVEAYKFRPYTVEELLLMSQDPVQMTKYFNSVCVRLVFNGTQTDKSIARGNLINVDFNFISQVLSQRGDFKKIQDRLLPEEQNISVKKAVDILSWICDIGIYQNLEEISDFPNYRKAILYYQSVKQSLPKIESVESLGRLFEVTFIEDAGGEKIGEFSFKETNKNFRVIRKNRRRVAREPIPKIIKKSLVVIEDERFWNFEPKDSPKYEGHGGVDLRGIVRAIGSEEGVQGASTITMQLIKNLILYKDVFREHELGKISLMRKLKEYILAKKMEEALSKDEILDWYLNTIDFGRGTQGIVLAAQEYFGKQLSELNTDEVAFLMSLPKAPNQLDPSRGEEAKENAINRRNIVLNKLRKFKYINPEESQKLRDTPLEVQSSPPMSDQEGYAQFYLNGVEKQLSDWFLSLGRSESFSYGVDVKIPINHDYQKWAVESLQRGLLSYERSRGLFKVNNDEDSLPNIKEKVLELAQVRSLAPREVFTEVLKKVSHPYVDGKQFELGVILSATELGTLRGEIVNRQPSDRPGKLSKIENGTTKPLKDWDVVLLQKFPKTNGGSYYKIASFTKVQGALVVIDNSTGAVLATSGGFSIGRGLRYKGKLGNRALTAYRQPGSTVKPFTYLLGLQKGLSTAKIISNADVSIPPMYEGRNKRCNTWSVRENYGEAQYSLRDGLARSKNKVTVRTFLNALGISDNMSPANYVDYIDTGLGHLLGLFKSFGLYTDLEKTCAPIILGSQETTPLELAGAYSTFAREGYFIEPYLIKSVTRNGITKNPMNVKDSVDLALIKAAREESVQGKIEVKNNFILRTMLQGVLEKGTARSIKEWKNIIAGKTGTTNNNKDAWFVGFNKDITVAVWVGNPDGSSLKGDAEGAAVALPIFKDFMEIYYEKYPNRLKDEFENNLSGMVQVAVEPNTGFIMSERLQQDYERYTGRTNKLTTEQVVFFSEEEMDRAVQHYYPTARVAGIFFFNSLTDSYKKYYQDEYNKYYSGRSTQQSQQYYRAYLEQKNYCDEWTQKGYGNYPEVRKSCALAQEYLNKYNNSRPNKESFKEYYLRVLGFSN